MRGVRRSLKRLEADTTLSRADRLTRCSRGSNWRASTPPKDAIAEAARPLLAEVREQARATTARSPTATSARR
jgi:hypothetical protein